VGIRFLADNHIAWVLSSWQICINRLPLLNEQVKISTWAYGMKAFYGYRNFTLEDAGVPTIVMEPVRGGKLALVNNEIKDMFKSKKPNMSVASWAMALLQAIKI